MSLFRYYGDCAYGEGYYKGVGAAPVEQPHGLILVPVTLQKSVLLGTTNRVGNKAAAIQWMQDGQHEDTITDPT